MRWIFSLLLVLVVDNQLGKGQVPVDLIITKLQKLDSNNDFTVEFTTVNTDVQTVASCTLLVSITPAAGGDTNQINVISTNIEVTHPDYTVTFPNILSDMEGNSVDFVINALNDAGGVISGGTAMFNPFPVFPIDVVMTAAKYDDGTLTEGETRAEQNILRVEIGTAGELNDIEPPPSGDIYASKGNIHYYLGIDSLVTQYSLCMTNSETVQICDAAIDVPPPTVAITNDLTIIESAILRYSNDAKAEEEIMVTLVGVVPATGVDAIVMDTEELCDSIGLVSTCPKSTFTLGGTYNMFIIGLDNANAMVNYATFDIIDYNVKGQMLSSTALEVRWDFQEAITKYRITKNPTSLGGFDEANVICEQTGSLTCFGYFTSLTPRSYKVTVQPFLSDDINVDVTNMIESHPIVVSPIYTGELELEFHQVKNHRDSTKIHSQVCFRHESLTEVAAFSHYEFVLINKKGQWMKHQEILEDSLVELCFNSLSINTRDFDGSDRAVLVVTQRAEDGFTILASGEKQVDFE